MSALFFGIFACFTALELPLSIIRKLFPQTEGILPLGGDEFTQLAILVMSALFTTQVVWLGHHCVKFLQRLRNDHRQKSHKQPTLPPVPLFAQPEIIEAALILDPQQGEALNDIPHLMQPANEKVRNRSR